MNSIQALLDITKNGNKRTFLIDGTDGETYSFARFHNEACAVASDLQARGLNKGDRIGLLLCNSPEFAVLYMACLYVGVVAVPVNPILGRQDINYILQHSRSKLLVVSAETVGYLDLEGLRGHCPAIILDQKHLRASSDTKLEILDIKKLTPRTDFVPCRDLSPDDTMTIVYTSGTTARPSGVVHRIRDIVDNARLFNTWLGINEHNRFYNILSMTYLGGYYNLLMLPYMAGSSVVIRPAFNAGTALDFWNAAIKYEVNTLWLVPTIISILLEMDRNEAGLSYCRSNVKLGLVGTAPLPVAIRSAFEKKYGVTLYENYGLSETLFISSNSPNTPINDGCVGRVLPGVQVTIRGAEGNALPYGEEGEIAVCTSYLMEGYYDSEKGVANRLDSNTWFPTGDIGVLSATGDLYITGRKKDLIIRGGINISPAAIENVVSQHPSVVESAAVSVPHPIHGEDVVIAVRVKSGSSFNDVQREILEMCKKELSSVQRPSTVVEMPEFPKSSSGKIQKSKVRELLLHKLGIQITSNHNKFPTLNTANKASIPSKIKRSIVRPNKTSIDRLSKFPVSIISDSLNRMGIMSEQIRPLLGGRSFCGPALTVEEIEGGNLMSHAALELVEAGDVIVIDAKGIVTRSAWGGIQTLMAHKKGAVAIIINGTVRDLEDIANTPLAIHAMGVSPGGPHKGWGGNVNYPVACGGVVVNPGDIVRGDASGVVVVRPELAEQLIECCTTRLTLESQWTDKVKQGEPTLDVVGLRQKLKDLGVVYE